MSTELSASPNKSSLASWWKSFKKKNPVAVDMHHDSKSASTHNSEKPQLQQLQQLQSQQAPSQLSEVQYLVPKLPAQHNEVGPRPILRYKSRSSNYVRPLSTLTNFSPSSSESLKAQRDSFIQLQKAKNNNDSQVFGVPLEKALSLASVNISISEDLANEGIQYGAIPVVVGKCCVFLKKNGTEVEGIFRVGGASRRVKELQFLFSTPPDYGRRLDWDGYTVHDAASLLRRFLNSLEEPLIPLKFYEQFREPLRSRPVILKFLNRKSVSKKIIEVNKDMDKAKEESTLLLPEEPVVGSENGHNDKIVEDLPQLNEAKPNGGESVEEAQTNEVDAAETHETTAETKVETKIETELEPEQDTTVAVNNHETDDKQDPEKAVETSLPVINTPQESNEGGDEKIDELTEEQKLKKLKKVKKYKKLIREIHNTLKEYSILLNQLPPTNQHLLFYILDMLTVFAAHSDKNLMSNKNLAAIFQPSILSHPDHDMSPEEYALSLQVVEFLLEYYRRLLEATQKLKSERSKVPAAHSQSPPKLEITTEADSVQGDSDQSGNTPVTPSGSLLPPVSRRANRKHSKSLSSVNLPPDGLKYSNIGKDDEKLLLQHYNSNTDADDSELDMERTPSRPMFAMDNGHNEVGDTNMLSPPKPLSPLQHKKSGDSLGNSSARFHNFRRPLSAVFSSKEKNLSIEDILSQDHLDETEAIDRQARWDQTGSPEHHKRENWFNRLRSRSRSSEPRMAQP